MYSIKIPVCSIKIQYIHKLKSNIFNNNCNILKKIQYVKKDNIFYKNYFILSLWSQEAFVQLNVC